MIDIQNSTSLDLALDINNASLNQYAGASLNVNSMQGNLVMVVENNAKIFISANSSLTVVGTSALDKLEVTDYTFDCQGLLDIN